MENKQNDSCCEHHGCCACCGKHKWIVLVVLIVLLGTAFYWHQWRPKMIREDCAFKAGEALKKSDFYDTAKYGNIYSNCLHESGLRE